MKKPLNGKRTAFGERRVKKNLARFRQRQRTTEREEKKEVGGVKNCAQVSETSIFGQTQGGVLSTVVCTHA